MDEQAKGRLNRRQFMRTATAAGAAFSATSLAAPAVRAADAKLKIGYVTPSTGPLAGFAEADAFNIGLFKTLMKDGLRAGGKTYEVEILLRDSQSNPNRAAQVAKDLIVQDQVNIMMVQATPETTVPVATQCEIEGVPCISSVVPWQPYFFSRQADPAHPKPFDYTYHFFWGIEDIIGVYTGMWKQIATDKKVAGLFPNDGDGNAWGDAALGFPAAINPMGYAITDPGRYTDLSDDFTAQIAAFKGADCQILTGVVLPPDFATFWSQARQQGYRPKVATIAKAILFPTAVEALGPAGQNLATEVWWGPTHPFTSSLNGMSCAAMAQAYTASTGRPWTQPIGFTHALIEAAIDTFKRSADPHDADANAKSMAALDLHTIVGPVRFGQDNVPPFARKNVCRTPLVGGQWRRGADGKYGLVVVENAAAPSVPLAGRMEPLG